MLAAIAEGHVDASDVLLLVAFIVFVVAAIASYVRQAPPRDFLPTLVPIGLALVTLAWLVL